MERKQVVIWGGTRGLGKQIARQSVARGHLTCITGRKPKEAMENPELAGIYKCDLADFDRVDRPGDGTVGRDFYPHALNADILFWVVGHWLRERFYQSTPEELVLLNNVHLLVPILRLNYLFRQWADLGRMQPFHLVVIASSSAVKVRDDGQAAYGALQAAKVQFARNLHAENERLLRWPVTIVRPGGMKTEFFDGTDVDTSAFADPAEVAENIWARVDLPPSKRSSLLEMDIAQKGDRLVVGCAPFDPLSP